MIKSERNRIIKIIFKESPDILGIINDIENQFQQKENIIKEAREKIEDEIERATNSIYIELDEDTYIKMFKKYLQILDKEK